MDWHDVLGQVLDRCEIQVKQYGNMLQPLQGYVVARLGN